MKRIQPVSDKDFDKMFHDKLYSLEIEPSETVWNNISNQIRKKKRPLPLFWLAAASITAIVGTMVWFSSQKEPMKLTGKTGREVIKSNEELVKAPQQKKELIIAEKQLPNVNYEIVSTIERKDVAKVTVTKKAPMASLAQSDDLESAVPEKVEPKEVLIVEERPISQPIQTLALASDAPKAHETGIENVETQRKQRTIKSVGSLVNFVVGKVDKRKNKIIEFEDGDEGTTVSSLNLGLLKFQAKQ